MVTIPMLHMTLLETQKLYNVHMVTPLINARTCIRAKKYCLLSSALIPLPFLEL